MKKVVFKNKNTTAQPIPPPTTGAPTMDQTATQVEARLTTEPVQKMEVTVRSEVLVMASRTHGFPSFELPSEGIISVGRNSKIVTMVLDDMSVSRLHARMQIAHKKIYLTDSDTINGTFVNNRRISTIAEVKVDDIMKFGNITYQLVLEMR